MRILLVIVLLFSAGILKAAKNCECGTHSTGITAWSVDAGTCCEGDPNAGGAEYTYYQESPGVWVVDTTTLVTGQSAQDDCCNATS